MGLDFSGLLDNSVIRQKASESLRGRWSTPIGLCLVIFLINNSSYMTLVGCIIIAGPFLLGLALFFLGLVKGEEVRFVMGFQGFNNFGSALGLFCLRALFVFLWSLLLIVPGIIMNLAYSQAFYILADKPDIGVSAALDKSRDMMRGAKGKLFLMHINFFLLGFLCLFTLGIGYIWLFPWMNTVNAAFYEDLKGNYQ